MILLYLGFCFMGFLVCSCLTCKVIIDNVSLTGRFTFPVCSGWRDQVAEQGRLPSHVVWRGKTACWAGEIMERRPAILVILPFPRLCGRGARYRVFYNTSLVTQQGEDKHSLIWASYLSQPYHLNSEVCNTLLRPIWKVWKSLLNVDRSLAIDWRQRSTEYVKGPTTVEDRHQKGSL